MKKSKINGFKPFTGYDDISDGLKIPTSKTAEPKPIIFKPPIQPFGKVEIDNRAFVPMTNLVPTIADNHVPEPKFKGLTRKQRQRVMPEDLNANEYGALSTKQEKFSYLALHGWSLKTEPRGNAFYYYATKYVKRKKKRFYVCPVSDNL